MIKQMKYLVCLLTGCTLSLSGQTIFDFEEDSLPGWLEVPAGRWERSAVRTINGEGSLHHAWDNPGSGVDQIARDLQYPDLSDTLAVSFRVRHGYPPSSGNNWQLFFLASDLGLAETDTGTHAAIIFGVNYAGHDDHLKLWQLVEGSVIELLDTGLDYQEGIGTAGEPLFRITRYPGGQWEAAWHREGNADALQPLGKAVEIQPLKGKYLGFRYSYSSAQDRKLWMDDISVRGSFFSDTVPPAVASVRILGLDGLEIKYNEPVAPVDGRCYGWNEQVPDSMLFSGAMHRIYFCDPFPNREVQQISVSGIRDPEDNVMRDTTLQFRQDLAAFGDIVINEIMSDPDPTVYLPGCEFVELYNRYHLPVDLGGWHLVINDREYDIQGTMIPPGAFLVLTHPDCNGRFGIVAQQSVLTSATALVNGGAVIRLRDQYGRLVHSLEYEAMERYGEENTDGGWSLERADPDNLCGGAENWYISISGKGGTPGTTNSHQFAVPDHDHPRITGLGVPSTQRINILFNEPIFIRDGDNTRFLVDDLPAVPVTGLSPFAGRDLLLVPGPPADSSTLYHLAMENVSDCAGNNAEDQRITFGMPSPPAPGMPVINEIMYDPVPGGSEYIELYNQGESFYDLFDLQLELREPGAINGTRMPLSEGSRLLFPGQYVVFCRQGHALRSEWLTGEDATVIGLDNWRSLPAGGACMRLTDRSGRSIDQVCYHDSMHHGLLEITSGVSLERIDPDCTTGPQCWTSAASSENYGTPGSRNSQAEDVQTSGQQLEITPKVFSPDGDGVDDCLQIAVGRLNRGGVADLYVTDISGNLVRQIIARGIPGTGDHFYWYGKDQQGRIVLPGIYLIHLRSVSNSGSMLQKRACAVVYR